MTFRILSVPMKKSYTLPKTVGGALIVGGTAIGAGMLALPVVSALGGFIPACFVYLICWLFSACTGLLFLEICMWMPQNANIVSMAHHLLGPIGKFFAWLLYLYLFYTLTIAYVAGGGGFIVSLFGHEIHHSIGIILFTVVFAAVVYMGTKAVDRINFLLMIGLIIAFVLFIIVGFGKVKISFLSQMHWGHAVLALPVIFTSFSYQGVIPSLNTYLDRDPKKMRYAILIGTALPFLAYIVWEFLILGIVPLRGAHGLLEAHQKGLTAVEPLGYFFPASPIFLIGQFFGAFALTTSFLGVTLGLSDFLADGLKVKKEGWKKVAIFMIIYIPPIVVASIDPTIFLKALGYAGGIGCALLLGLFPVMMVWAGRYTRKYSAVHTQLPGGKLLLLILAGFVVFELIVELMQEIM